MESCVLRPGQCSLYQSVENLELRGNLPPALRCSGQEEAGVGSRQGSVSLEFLLFNPTVPQSLNRKKEDDTFRIW